MNNPTTSTDNGTFTPTVLDRDLWSSDPNAKTGKGNQIEWLDRSEDAAWDQFVESHPHGTVCQTTQWRDMIESAFSHIRAQTLVIRDGISGPIRAGMMAYVVRSWLLGNRVVSVPFSSRVDPLTSSPADLRVMLDFLDSRRREMNVRSLQVRLLKVMPENLPETVTAKQNLKRHYIPLDKPVDALYKQLHASCIRRWIKKAESGGVTVRTGRKESDWDILFRIYGDTRQRLHLPVMPRRFFSAAGAHLKPEQWELFIAEKDGRPLGAGLFLIFNGVQQLEWVGDTAEGRATGANQKMYWEAVKDSVERGCHTFCFGRTDDHNSGLLDYKRRWGSIEEDIHLVVSGAGADSMECRADTSITRSIAQRIVDASPRPVYLGFSEFCYRHLG